MALERYVHELINQLFKGGSVDAEDLNEIQAMVKAGEKTGAALTELKREIKGDTSEDMQIELRKIRDAILSQRKKGGRSTRKGRATRRRVSRRS